MTLAEILSSALRRAGFTPSSQYAQSNRRDDLQILEAANEEISEVKLLHQWPQLKEIFNLTLTSATEYDLPDHWGNPVPDTAWSSSRSWRVDFPVSDELWAYLQTRVGFSGVTYRVRVRKGKLEVHSPNPGDTMYFEYISNCPVASSDSTPKVRFTEDNDVSLIDDELLIRGCHWRFLRAKNKPFDTVYKTWMNYRDMLYASETGAQIVRTISRDIRPYNEPYTDLYLDP